MPCRRQCLTGGPFIHCKLAKWEQPKGALQAKVPYRGGALQGHDHCTLFVTCCRHPVYSSRTFPSTFLLFVWRQKLLICYHHFPVLARYTYLLLKDLGRYISNGDYLSRTLSCGCGDPSLVIGCFDDGPVGYPRCCEWFRLL